MNNKVPIDLVINRDENMQASGKVFLDDGVSIASLEADQNEFYDIVLSAGVLKKMEVHTPVSSGIKLGNIVITNADDLQDVDFACWTNKDTLASTDLKYTPDAGSHTLTISNPDGTPIDMTVFRDIIFGNSKRDINLCDVSKNYYALKDGATTIDLSASTATATLSSLSGSTALPDLTLTLTYLKTGIVNFHWTFAAQ